MKNEEAIAAALKGEESSITIFWDAQDSKSQGPAYRLADNADSGSLDFRGWAHVSGREPNKSEVIGYALENYFLHNGAYAGPDSDGIYPILSL